MESSDILKYSKKSLPQLKAEAQKIFNKWVRERSIAMGLGCCSCDSRKIEHASHLYSVGHYQALRYEPDNCWGSCLRCNYHLRGNIQEYRLRLIKLIGKERVEALDDKAAYYKRNTGFKWDRFSLIDIILKYK